jgi:hypothetical protein
VYEWDIINENKPGCRILNKFDDHEENIMSICEIHTPLMIATASIDKTIRIYSLVDKSAIGVISYISNIRFLKNIRLELEWSPIHLLEMVISFL